MFWFCRSSFPSFMHAASLPIPRFIHPSTNKIRRDFYFRPKLLLQPTNQKITSTTTMTTATLTFTADTKEGSMDGIIDDTLIKQQRHHHHHHHQSKRHHHNNNNKTSDIEHEHPSLFSFHYVWLLVSSLVLCYGTITICYLLTSMVSSIVYYTTNFQTRTTLLIGRPIMQWYVVDACLSCIVVYCFVYCILVWYC